MATVTSETLYSTAKRYMKAAFKIITNPYRLSKNQIDAAIILSYFVLPGFALELYIKAWLVADGVQEPWGHDLDKLHAEAVTSDSRLNYA